ncbi:Coq4 family protein [Phenylobacterium sp.]|uniref:Coq4 family protein n=1 Tax=Phenylobacterium sp. TaxID=1871053 RepID=UPI00398371EC
MITRDQRLSFEAQTVASGSAATAQALAARLKTGLDPADLEALAALWLHASAAAPERLPAIYDASAGAWLGAPVSAPAVVLADAAPEAIPQAFWDAYWDLLETPGIMLDAGGVTQRTAALSGLLSGGLGARVGKAALAYPGCAAAVDQGYPERFTLAALSRCPRGSLGGEFHALIVDNGFDLEVLDREALGLAHMAPPLDYLNARILQCHDLWHIAAGYRTTSLHEVAISGFQMGQFGHHYSSMFLAMVLSRLAFERPEGGSLMLDIILAGWKHGRESPPLLGVDWPALWTLPTEDIRARLGLVPYASPWPADLFEQLTAA